MSEQTTQFGYAEGGVVAPLGFLAAGINAGIKRTGKRDICLVAAEQAVSAAAVFTRNSMAAPPVVLSRRSVANGHIRAVVINSGNANACTGDQGLRDAEAMASTTAQALGCSPAEVVVGSTGVIGVPMPIDAVTAGIAEAATELDARSDAGDAAAEAIMTTDTFAKQTAITVEVGGERYTVGGIAKGSGMIMPDMATMLAVVTTDAPLTPTACDVALRSAVDATFNRITVDSDTSTNDMCVLLASGAAGGRDITTSSESFAVLCDAIREVCGELARMIVRDGEGATRFVTVSVRGAASDGDARDAAFAVANSPLVKTAIFGGDANWGRVVMAVGKSGAEVDSNRIEVLFAGLSVCRNGTAVPFDEAAASAALAEPEVDVVVDLHIGSHDATVWTCDLSYEYVRINGEYRT